MNEPTMHDAGDGFEPAEMAPLAPFPWPDGIERVLARYERRIINHALANSHGIKRRAAVLLGVSRYALERRMVRLSRVLDREAVGAGHSFAAEAHGS